MSSDVRSRGARLFCRGPVRGTDNTIMARQTLGGYAFVSARNLVGERGSRGRSLSRAMPKIQRGRAATSLSDRSHSWLTSRRNQAGFGRKLLGIKRSPTSEVMHLRAGARASSENPREICVGENAGLTPTW